MIQGTSGISERSERTPNMTMFQSMLKQIPDKELEEVRAQVVAKGLFRKVAT